MENKFGSMTYDELKEIVFDDKALAELSEPERMQLDDRLTNIGRGLAAMLDQTHGIDPRKGKPVVYGTPNRKSYTYKMRKAMGFSYP